MCSLSRRENAEALVHSAFCKQNYPFTSLIFTPRETRAKPSFCKGCFRARVPAERIFGGVNHGVPAERIFGGVNHGVPAERIFGGVNLIQMRASGRREVETEKTSCSSRSSTRPKQERVETNGDGVKPGHPLAGHGGANVQLGRICPSLNIFSGSPPKVFSVGLSPVPVCFGVICALIQHPLGGYGVFKLVYRVYVP